MDAKCLTTQQRGAVRGRVLRQRKYLVRLVARMDAVAFSAEDPVRVPVVEAGDKVGGILEALDAAEQSAPFLANYGTSEPIERKGMSDTASMPWVGKRGKSRQRR